MILPQQSEIVHHPYTLRLVRPGRYHAYRGEKHFASLIQNPGHVDRLPNWWRLWPAGRGEPGCSHATIEMALEELREFDTEASGETDPIR